MKQFTILLLFFVQTAAGAWIDSATREKYENMVLPHIEDAQMRAQAAEAIRAYSEAEDYENAAKAIVSLGRIDAAPARMAALFFVVDPKLRENYSSSFVFGVHDLPLLLTWILNNGITISELLSTDDSVLKSLRLNALIGEVNEILSTTGEPESDIDDIGWNAYSQENLRRWAVKQIKQSLSKITRNAHDTAVLQQLLAILNATELPPVGDTVAYVDMTSRGVGQAQAGTQGVARGQQSSVFWLYTGAGVAVLSILYTVLRRVKRK